MLQKMKFNREMKIFFFGRDLDTVDQHHAHNVEPSSQKVILILLTCRFQHWASISKSQTLM